MTDPAADPLRTLQHYFGHASFRAGQRELVEAVLEGRDLLAVMPTGSGKSVGFQLPAVWLPGLTLVVSPLIALMKDQVCRYALRPPVAYDRIHWTGDGQVLVDLRHRWADGTTHLVFDPIELMERLAALTPRPRINLVLYYGVLGARAVWRSRLGAAERPAGAPAKPRCRAQTRTGVPHRRPLDDWPPIDCGRT